MKEETNKAEKEGKGNIVCYVFIVGIILFAICAKLSSSSASYLEQREKKSYVIKVLDGQGNIVRVFQNKTYSFHENRLYVCPKQEIDYCPSLHPEAIVISNNYIIEPEN